MFLKILRDQFSHQDKILLHHEMKLSKYAFVLTNLVYFSCTAIHEKRQQSTNYFGKGNGFSAKSECGTFLQSISKI